MKKISRILVFVLVLSLALCLVPALGTPAKAASTPILVLSSTTAVNPILDHVLSFETFSTGGPFTIEWEWKSDIKSNDPSDPDSFKAGVSVTGFIYGTTDVYQWDAGFEGYNPPILKGKTDWTKGSFQFQNVGTYPMTGTSEPGNILRFSLWKARGSVYIRNLIIKNDAGDVLYNLNTDPVVTQLVTNLESMGMTEADISELAAIDYANCPWVAGQFSTGKYTSSIHLESDGNINTTSSSSMTRPTASSSSTTKPSSASSSVTTKPSSVSSSVTTVPSSVPTSDPTSEPTTEPTTVPTTIPTTEPTTVPTTAPTTEPTTAPTTAPTTDSSQEKPDDSKPLPPVLVIVFAIVTVVICVVFFIMGRKSRAS